MRDVAVIGADLADPAVTIKAADAGLNVTFVTKDVGGIQLGTSTVDILDYRPEPVETPLEALEGHVASRPTHLYSHVIPNFIGASVAWLRSLVGANALVSDETRNARIPTGVDALHPTYLVPPSMKAGIPQAGAHYAIAGLTRFKDFYPGPVTEDLARQNDPDGAPINAHALSADYVVREDEIDSTDTNRVHSLDHEENRARLADQIRLPLQDGEIVGLPAVLGLDDPNAWRDFADRLGHPAFGTPVQPPSVPGMCLDALLTRIASDKYHVILGSPIRAVYTTDGRVSAIEYTSVGRSTIVEARSLILATDDFESGALDMGSYDTMRETIYGLPVMSASRQLLHVGFWGEGQPLFLAGLAVDDNMCILNEKDAPVRPNLYAAEGNLVSATHWREGNGKGIALANALAAVNSIVEELK